MFKERLLSSLVFVPLVAGAFCLGGYYFAAFVAFVAAVGSVEYRRILKSAGVDLHPALVPLSVLVALSGFLPAPLFVACLLGAVLVILSIEVVKSKSATSAMFSLSGVMYVGGLFGALSLLREGPRGEEWAFLVLLVTWATDVGAYLGGRAFGKHKLAPQISPGKSWEGAAFGTAAAALVGVYLAQRFGATWAQGLLGGIMLAVVGELGDLVESSLKRFGKVKDSGRIMPGHGGILDRFDSLLFTAAGGLVLRTLCGLLTP